MSFIACNFLHFLRANYSHQQNIDANFFVYIYQFELSQYFLANAVYIDK